MFSKNNGFENTKLNHSFLTDNFLAIFFYFLEEEFLFFENRNHLLFNYPFVDCYDIQYNKK